MSGEEVKTKEPIRLKDNNDCHQVASVLEQDEDYKEREAARNNYLPGKIKYLLIAEAPPIALERFFYYPYVKKGDVLYAEVMRAVSSKMYDIDTLRTQKHQFLKTFMDEGFYLIDAVDTPFPRRTDSRKRRNEIKRMLPCLIKKIRCLKLDGAKVIIIKATVHGEVYSELKLMGLDVVNAEMIDFPGRRTKQFREKMPVALASYYEERGHKAVWP